eukprot:scaffold35922_cov65-Phaeocystis_antarctica.AAC.6
MSGLVLAPSESIDCCGVSATRASQASRLLPVREGSLHGAHCSVAREQQRALRRAARCAARGLLPASRVSPAVQPGPAEPWWCGQAHEQLSPSQQRACVGVASRLRANAGRGAPSTGILSYLLCSTTTTTTTTTGYSTTLQTLR